MNSSGVGLVDTKKVTFAHPPDELVLESGSRIGPITVAYETYGELNEKGDNAILVLHALTGDAHAAGKNSPEDRKPGWWDPMVGRGRALDTDKYFIICSNVLGGCSGTTGPASMNPATGKPYGMDFPIVTIRDMVNVQKKLLDHLGVKSVVTALGGSMGGMQSFEWAVMYPEMVRSVIPIASPVQLSAQGIAYNEVQRQAIIQDPDWKEGNYYGTPGPQKGLALARMIGTITYKSDEAWNIKFGRTFGSLLKKDYYVFDSRFEVENYLHYQGKKLVRRFDANSYLYLTKAMDLYDLSRYRGDSLVEVLERIMCKILLIGIRTDFLYPPYMQKEVVKILRRLGKDASYRELNSPYGHDAFLIEFDMLTRIIKGFLSEIEKEDKDVGEKFRRDINGSKSYKNRPAGLGYCRYRGS